MQKFTQTQFNSINKEASIEISNIFTGFAEGFKQRESSQSCIQAVINSVLELSKIKGLYVFF